MVAAAKMRKAQQAALEGRPYARLLSRTLVHIHRATSGDLHPLLRETPEDNTDGRHLVYVISTDRGLCGALNTNLFRELLKLDEATTDFVVSGRKARSALQRLRRPIKADFELHDNPSYRQTREIAKYLMDCFLEGRCARVSVLHTHFKSTLSQEPRLMPILPISAVAAVAQAMEDDDSTEELEFKFEPNPRAVLDVLLPHFFNFAVHTLVLDARASEHSARMVAMKNATDNAKDLMKDLTLQYNRIRQDSITKELLEISSAQAAMGG